MNITRRISLYSHLINLKSLINLSLTGTFFIILFTMLDVNLTAPIICLSICFILLIPSIVIHINFYKTDKGKTIIINHNESWLILEEKKKKLKITQSDIKEVFIFDNNEGRMINFWNYYCYYLIKLNNGNEVILTSLILRKSEFPFHINYTRNKFIPLVETNENSYNDKNKYVC